MVPRLRDAWKLGFPGLQEDQKRCHQVVVFAQDFNGVSDVAQDSSTFPNRTLCAHHADDMSRLARIWVNHLAGL